MYWLISLMTLGLVGLVLTGIYLELRPDAVARGRRWHRPAIAGNLALFVLAQAALMILGAQEAMANPAVEAAIQGEMSVGMGLALIGAGIPTALSTVGAGIAVGPIGAASLAAVAEKPEIFGRTLIYLGLAEGIAIYGLVVSILLLGKI
jgi:V/A-type H+-transporting ATPase subunit K